MLPHIIIGILFLGIFYFYLIRPFTFWSRRGVSQKSVWIIWKDILNLTFRLRSNHDVHDEDYKEFVDKRYYGAYKLFLPVLCVTDVVLIKEITVQAFDHFSDRHTSVAEQQEPLWGRSLACLKGSKWHEMRTAITPLFTASKMRNTFDHISEYTKEFVEHFTDVEDVQNIDVKDVTSRFTNDVNALIAFGVKTNSLKDRNNDLYLIGKEATNFDTKWSRFKHFVMVFLPKLAKVLGIKMFCVHVEKFLTELVKSGIESRRKTSAVAKDLLHMLLQTQKSYLAYQEIDNKNGERSIKQLTDEDFAAQALIFLIGGLESVSSFMCYLFYEIAANPTIQAKLHQEILTATKSNKTITYDAISSMKYMDLVLKEVLRKWPSAIFLERMCIKPYTIKPVNKQEQHLHLKPGDLLWLHVSSIHRNATFYPNPNKIQPERFCNANPPFFSFGFGPRICLGNRFALLQTKTLLVNMLRSFEFVLTRKTKKPQIVATDEFPFFFEKCTHAWHTEKAGRVVFIQN